MTSKAETQARLMESYGWQDAADELRRLESELAEFQQVGWAISYDGKTPWKMWMGDEASLDLEARLIGGTACKMALFAKVEKWPSPQSPSKATRPARKPCQGSARAG